MKIIYQTISTLEGHSHVEGKTPIYECHSRVRTLLFFKNNCLNKQNYLLCVLPEWII